MENENPFAEGVSPSHTFRPPTHVGILALSTALTKLWGPQIGSSGNSANIHMAYEPVQPT